MVPKPRFDALIVFGYGPVQPGVLDGAGNLNLYGRLNAMAAGFICRASAKFARWRLKMGASSRQNNL